MRSLRSRLMLALGLITLLGLQGAAPVAVQADPTTPERVLIIVLDQTRRDTIERYDMQNVQALMDGGVSFPRAYLGHMAAETVISHNVMTSGLFPKHMGWSNEVFRDVDNALGGGAGAYYVSSSMGCSQFDAIINNGGYMKLQDYLDDAFGDSTFAALAQKRTAACSAGHTSSPSLDPGDFIFQIRGSGAGTGVTCDGLTSNAWRKPEAVSRPSYIPDPNTCNPWWTLQSTTPPLDYGTTTAPRARMYPLEGNRFMPGIDGSGNQLGPADPHVGGDTWSANAAIAVIENDPDWRGMLVSLGAIDKMGHMWGTQDRGSGQEHLPATAKLADEQVGRILQALDDAGIRDETLVVLTADHGAQTGKRFHGIDALSRGDFNWYCGKDSDETYLQPSPAIAQLRDALDGDCDPSTSGGDLDFSYQDSHIAAWLSDPSSMTKLHEAADAMRGLPDVVAAYYREGDHYVRRGGVGSMTAGERRWFDRHAQELVDTMAAPYGPDVVGLLRNDTTYGVYGDHGGHQKQVQNIPIAFSWPGLQAGATPGKPLRSVDILPTILRTMGISFDASSMDGTAFSLPLA